MILLQSMFLIVANMSANIPLTDFNVPWSQAVWLNRPAQVAETETGLSVTTDADTDFWRVSNFFVINISVVF